MATTETPVSTDTIAVPPTTDTAATSATGDENTWGELRVIRRNGKVTAFDADKITVAVTKAFLAVEGGSAAASARVHDVVRNITQQVTDALVRRNPDGGTVHIEDIQDQVELALMRAGEHKVARDYVLYREARAQEREQARKETGEEEHLVNITLADGTLQPLNIQRLRTLVEEACNGLEETDPRVILDDSCRNLFDGVKEDDVSQTLVMSARTLIESEPNYSY
ncbi:MAG TPA: ribonucleoside-diphosphate reductase subunit alpha, partial [Chromatiaceae bacterium]|nr:ribonucleoside-diphosphate reductase subunit alpha [Chromatiaceae bacterium]